MPALTPSFVYDLESRMRFVTENEYARLAAAKDWSRIARVLPSQSRRELIHWILSTVNIYDMGTAHGQQVFEDMQSIYTEYSPTDHRAGLKLNRQQFEDLDGNGIQFAAAWSSQAGAKIAYYPQKLVTDAIKNGTSLVGYDKVVFFSASHPVNGRNTDQGTFSNLLTSLPIDPTVSVDVALANLAKAQAQIASIKMPDGATPRYLRATTLIVPPALAPRASQLTNAKFVAQAATGGAGAADVEKLIGSIGIGKVIVFDELGAAFGGSDTVYYLMCEDIAGSTELGAFVLVDRDPFKITYYTGEGGGAGTDAILDRADELEWHLKGRMVVGPGHPYLLFKSN